ncbi:MAG: hypothetical protein ABIR67_15300 [Gaiellaceae bacterium]
MRINSAENVAVFSRNHRDYLEEAKTIGARDPSERVVFRAKAKWATAERAIGRLGPIPIYLAAIGAAGQVEYEAKLCEVLLDPVAGSPEADEWLDHVLEATASEGLWDPPVSTLYAICACRTLKQPLPITRLVKLSDGEPISADYGYSYAIVRAIDDLE